jgi:hypothetical protein
MARLTDADIEAIARRIVADLNPGASAAPAAAAVTAADHNLGIFPTVDEAVKAAREAQPVYVALPLQASGRKSLPPSAPSCSKTPRCSPRPLTRRRSLGRFEDKITKNLLVTEKTPGLEHLVPEAITGDHGLTLLEPAPFGVIGAITPCTNPTSTIICNTIGMIAAGNTVVFNVHPTAKNCSMQTVGLINKTIQAQGGPRNVVTCVSQPNHRERRPDHEAPAHPPRGGDGRRRQWSRRP